jgi:hypothetical protein
MVFIVLALLALPEYRRWESYGGGPEQIRYSSLRQIHRGNVKDLEVAWTYDTGETRAAPDPAHHRRRRSLCADAVAQGVRSPGRGEGVDG